MGRTLKQNSVTGSYKKDMELYTPSNYTGINSGTEIQGENPATVPTQTQYTVPMAGASLDGRTPTSYEATPTPTPTSEPTKVNNQNNSGVWKSYSDAVAAGFSNIRTESEFNRGGSDKKIYGTYQAYLDAMYEKYVVNDGNGSSGGGMTSTPATTPTESGTNTDTSGTNTDTSGTGTEASGTEAGTEPEPIVNVKKENIPTFEEFIEQEKQTAYLEAEKSEQRAIVDAKTSYALATSNYGANAEALGQMGMGNSGYSEYMRSQAYATMRGEAQAASAQTAYLKREADDLASDRMVQLSDKFEGVLTGIADGTYDRNYVKALVATGRYTDEQVAAMSEALVSYETSVKNGTNIDTTDSNYQLTVSNVETSAYSAGSVASINQLAASAGITDADRDRIISDVQTGWLNTVLGQIDTASAQGTSVSTESWDDLLKNGLLTEDAKTQIIKKYSNSLPQGSKIFYETDESGNRTGNYMNVFEAMRFLKELNENQWIDDSVKEIYQIAFDSVYGYEHKMSFSNFELSDYNIWNRDGDNFEVRFGDERLDVQAKKVVSSVKKILVELGKDGIYELNGRIYLKNGGNVIEIVARDSDDSRKDFATLKSRLGLNS